MQTETLFGYLANRFSSQPENLATEALNYIINRSAIAKQAFLHYIAQTTVNFTTDLYFQTQAVGSDKTIPDLIGIDLDGDQVLIIEAKFWAGLTDNQPVAYLNRLPKNKNSLLLLIAPRKRFPTLWPELIRRCKNDDIAIEKVSQISNDLRIGHIDANRVLALSSWQSILSYVFRKLDTSGQTQIASDVMQLQGLCEQMDSESFLPIRSEELASSNGRRIWQYCELVDEITEQLKTEHQISTKGLRASAGFGYYGRNMKISDFGCFLHFNVELWSDARETPLWLMVKSADWNFSKVAKEYLSKLELETPSRLLEFTDGLYIPLFLPISVEKDEVVKSLLAQMHEIIEYLRI